MSSEESSVNAFTPLMDVRLLWSKLAYPDSSWNEIAVFIDQQYGYKIDPACCQQRYEDYLELPKDAWEFYFSKQGIDGTQNLVPSESRPQDYIYIYKDIREAKQLQKTKQRSTQKQKQHIQQLLYDSQKVKSTQHKRKIKIIRKMQGSQKKIQAAFEKKIHNNVEKLYKLIKVRENNEELTMGRLKQVLIELVEEVINQLNTIIVLESYEISEKYLVHHQQELLEFIEEWILYGKLTKIMELYFIKNTEDPSGQDMKEIAKELRQLRLNMHSVIDIDSNQEIKCIHKKSQQVKLEPEEQKETKNVGHLKEALRQAFIKNK